MRGRGRIRIFYRHQYSDFFNLDKKKNKKTEIKFLNVTAKYIVIVLLI